MARIASLLTLLITTPLAAAEGDAPNGPEAGGDTRPAAPPVNILPTHRGPRQPNVSAGILPAVCGIGDTRPWQRTRFCLGGVVDLLWGRQHESESGFGLAVELTSAGFRDLGASLGPSGFLPLNHWFGLGLRAGPLMRIERAVSLGGRAALELGHRNFYTETHYSLMHALFVAVDVTAASGRDPAAHALWFGLRLDGFWLTAPAWWLQ